MQVKIKKFVVDMEVKTNGIEFEVRQPNGETHVGDCFLTKTGLEWCKGRRNSGIKISWNEFIQIMTSNDTKKAAIKAAEKETTE